MIMENGSERVETMRLIDLDSPQVKYLNGFEEKFMGQTVLEWLDDMPTVDAVKVVRCGECVYHRRCMLQHFVESNVVDGAKIDWNRWFCADGERREEE